MSLRRSRSTRTTARRRRTATTRARPSALLMLLEGRAPIEFFSLFAALPWLTRAAARRRSSGDGLPGHGRERPHDRAAAPLPGAASATSPRPGGRGSTSARAPACIERCADDLRALAEQAWPAGQPDRLEPGRHLRARARQAASDARRAASSRSARRSPAIRRRPTPGASTSCSAAARSATPS